MPASRNPTVSSSSAHDRGLFIVVRPRVLSRKTAAAAAAMAAVLEKRIEMLQSELYGIGILDEQFAQLQLLEDESNPNFVSEMVTLYFEDTGCVFLGAHSGLHPCRPWVWVHPPHEGSRKGPEAPPAPEGETQCVCEAKAARTRGVEKKLAHAAWPSRSSTL